MTHGIARSTPFLSLLFSGLLAATLSMPAALPAVAASVGGGGGIVIQPPASRGTWEGRLRIVHHYYDLVPDDTTYQIVSGSSQAQCNTVLTAAFAAAMAAEPTALVEYDVYCAWHA